MIGTPCYGGLLSEAYLHGIMDLTRVAAQNNFQVNLNTIGNESLITRARNTLVSQFLDMEPIQLLLDGGSINDAIIDHNTLMLLVNSYLMLYEITDGI